MRFEPSSNAPVTPAESVEWGRRLSAMLGGPSPKKRETEVLVALSMKQSLTSYTKIPTPARPVDIESLDDDTIVAAVKKAAAHGKRLTKDDLHTVRLFAMWRNMVWLVESRNVGRLESIVWAARVFEELSVEFPAHGRDLAELADFIDATWSYQVLPKVPGVWEVRQQAPALVRDLVQLPYSLRLAGGGSSERGDGMPKSLGASLGAGGGWMNEFEATGDADADE